MASSASSFLGSIAAAQTPKPNPANPLPSQRVGSFVNQALSGLSPATGSAGPSPMPMAPRLAALSARAAPVSVVQKSSMNIMNQVKEGNARMAVLGQAAKKAQQVKLGNGQNVGAGQAGAYTGPGYTGPRMGGGPGQISVNDTIAVSNGQRLRKDSGAAFLQMAAAFKQATGKSLGLTEGWRSYDRQVQLYNLYKAGKGNLAAKPGSSTHGKGTAVDINGMGAVGSASFNWLRQNAPKFGYSWTGGGFSQVEPWHWDFKG